LIGGSRGLWRIFLDDGGGVTAVRLGAFWVIWPGCFAWFAECRLGSWRGSW
jgi:hypothetical protein